MEPFSYGIWILAAGLAAMDAQVAFGGRLTILYDWFFWERSGGMGTVAFQTLEELDEFLWDA